MKKIAFIVLILCFGLFLVTPITTHAQGWCANTSVNPCCDESNRGAIDAGFVPCGKKLICETQTGTDIATGQPVYQQVACDTCNAQPLGCVNYLECRCELYHVFFLMMNVYKFIIWTIALPLAGLLLMIGGILLIVSGGGKVPIPGVKQGASLYSMGTKIITGAVVGLGLILGSFLIIQIVLTAIGYQGGWWIF